MEKQNVVYISEYKFSSFRKMKRNIGLEKNVAWDIINSISIKTIKIRVFFGRHPLEGYMTSERDEQNKEVGRVYVRQPEEMVAHSDLANFLLLPGACLL